MKIGDTVIVRRHARPGRPRKGDAPEVLRGTVIKTETGRVFVNVGGQVVIAARRQVQPDTP